MSSYGSGYLMKCNTASATKPYCRVGSGRIDTTFGGRINQYRTVAESR